MKLTEPMKRTLRVMAEGHEIELWWGKGTDSYWVYTQPPKLGMRIDNSVAWDMLFHDLVKRVELGPDRPSYAIARYALTEAGRRAAGELINA